MLAGSSYSRNAFKRSAGASSSCLVKSKLYDSHPICLRCLATRSATSRQLGYEDVGPRRSFFPRQTQSQLFAVSPDSRFSPQTPASQGARLKMQLAECAEAGHSARAVRICAEMKKAGIAPDVTVYNWLIHACAKQGLGSECLAFLEDMEVLNIKPTIDTFNYVIFAQRWSKTFNLEDILDRMEKAKLKPNTHTFHHIILRYVEAQNLEMCLQFFSDMSESNVSPSLKSTQAVIELGCNIGHPRLAFDIACAFEASSVRKLETEDWVRILVASTGSLFEQGVLYTWQKVVNEHHVTPDEGICLEVLHVAGRHGLTNLALHALQIINSLGVPLQEYHLAPILEAFCKHALLEDAFAIINLMRTSGILLNQQSADPILTLIRQDIEHVDKAWTSLERMHADGKAVDVVLLNVIIRASSELRDLQRAIGVYKSFPNFGIKPSVETINFILSGCISTGHKELGDKMLEELQKQDLVPNTATFERIILLCLTQNTYEDAFYYLEEMKGQGHRPPLSVYEALIKKCIVNGDMRWKIAMDELLECGYSVSPRLRDFVKSGGRMAGNLTGNSKEEVGHADLRPSPESQSLQVATPTPETGTSHR